MDRDELRQKMSEPDASVIKSDHRVRNKPTVGTKADFDTPGNTIPQSK